MSEALKLLDRVAALERQVKSLQRAIALLHRISGLVGTTLERDATYYAILTGTTAGVGLGFNRAMLFLTHKDQRGQDEPASSTHASSLLMPVRALYGAGAVGPVDRDEADRVWRSIERESPDLTTLHDAGLRRRDQPSELDRRVRAASIDPNGRTPVALAYRRWATVIGEGDDDAGGLFHPPTAVAAPLTYGHAILGILYADNRFTEKPADPMTAKIVAMVAEQAARAIANAERYEKIAGEARTDALTGLGHHGAFQTDLVRAADTASETGRPVGLVMIDLDGFKPINDGLGHQAGDALLAGLAARMRGAVRVVSRPGKDGFSQEDRVYRYGGDEFAAILPDADRATAALVGERIRASIAERPFALGSAHRVQITCSVGVAAMPEDAARADLLLASADAALLRAKARGRNRVVTAVD